MSTFEYTLKFRNNTAPCNVDALSRLPLPVEPAVSQLPPELVLLADHLSNSPVTADQICECTRKDPQLAQIVQFVQQGWPSSCPSSDLLSSFYEKRMELSLYEGCLLWGNRVVILILIDAHSKWIEATCTHGSTSAVVIDKLQTLFAQFGLPETI